MSPAVRNPNFRSIRCGWRCSVQLICAAAVLMAGTSAGSGWIRAHAVEPAATQATQAAQAGVGGPYIPANLAAGKPYDLAADLGELDAIPPGKGDALDVSAAIWNAAQHPREGLPKLLPVAPVRITSGFGRRHDPFGRGDAFHSGIDFAGVVGTPVHASGDGIVMQARYSKDYGNVVMIDHGQGVVTLYAHNSRLEVRTGDAVLAGQEIARMGSTGRSTGPHLHFEVRQYGQRMDPGHYLAGL
jgi:murein DD-endopeptidase MepM/ murein hydrolase activator NlpD